MPRSGFDCDGPDLEHLGLAVQRVAVEDRVRVAELLGREVGDRLAGDVADRHPERQRVDERPDDDVPALLRLAGVDVVEVQRVVVHRDQAEEVVVGLGDRLRGPVLVDGADLELLEVAAVGVGARCLAPGLVGDQLMGLVVAHCSSFGSRSGFGSRAGAARLSRVLSLPRASCLAIDAADQPQHRRIAADLDVRRARRRRASAASVRRRRAR